MNGADEHSPVFKSPNMCFYKSEYIFFIQSLHAAPINPKAHRLWCLHPFIDVYTLNYNFTVTSRCDPAAFTLCFSSKPHREGGDRIFGERFQYEKSPSGDEKSSLPLTSKRPHCSLTLKICLHISSPHVRYLGVCCMGWGVGRGQVKAHVGPGQVWRTETSWFSIFVYKV